MSVFKNESKEMQETTSAAAKKKDECVDKDAEILRLIEERRKMPKEERHRLKELSKELKKCIRERVKRHHDIERILEEFKDVRNIPRIKTAKKRVFITTIKNKKVNASLLEKESPIPLENSTRDSMKTVEKTTLNMKRKMTKEYLKSRLKNFKVQSASPKLASLQTEMVYELKTSKIATTRREK